MLSRDSYVRAEKYRDGMDNQRDPLFEDAQQRVEPLNNSKIMLRGDYSQQVFDYLEGEAEEMEEITPGRFHFKFKTGYAVISRDTRLSYFGVEGEIVDEVDRIICENVPLSRGATGVL